MSAARGCQVLLISAAPEAHGSMLDSLLERGIQAETARTPLDAQRLLRLEPEIVLVDLVYGTGLDGSGIASINQNRGRALVVALHDGGFGEFYNEVASLAVDGFCRAGDWRTIANATPAVHRSFALH